jgi:hypothetical protein
MAACRPWSGADGRPRSRRRQRRLRGEVSSTPGGAKVGRRVHDAVRRDHPYPRPITLVVHHERRPHEIRARRPIGGAGAHHGHAAVEIARRDGPQERPIGDATGGRQHTVAATGDHDRNGRERNIEAATARRVEHTVGGHRTDQAGERLDARRCVTTRHMGGTAEFGAAGTDADEDTIARHLLERGGRNGGTGGEGTDS